MRRITHLACILAVTFVSSVAFAAKYDIDPAHSEVGFKIRHLVSKTRGRFDKFSGTVQFDPTNLAKLSTDVTIDTKSINTNSEKRDTHLRSADFFNVEKFPIMTFKSTSAKKIGDNKLQLMGNLTLLGVTKPVALEVEYTGEANDPWGNVRSGFTAVGKINRKDFGMTYNITDKGGVVIGDDVDLLIEVETIKQK